MSKGTDYCLTVFDTEWSMEGNDNVKYGVSQIEECPSTGRKHQQTFVILKNEVKITSGNTGLTKALKLKDIKYHAEARSKGSREQARDYCMKTESRVRDPVEIGTFPDESGDKDDELSIIQKKIENGVSMKIIAKEHFGTWTRNYRAFQLYKDMMIEPRDRMKPKTVKVFMGGAGKGKTLKAFEEMPDGDYYVKMSTNNWWNGYEGQKTILIDDFNGTGIEFKEFLRITDRYPCQVETKGGMKELNADTIYITTDVEPAEWYPMDDTGNIAAQVTRRITEIVRF